MDHDSILLLNWSCYLHPDYLEVDIETERAEQRKFLEDAGFCGSSRLATANHRPPGLVPYLNGLLCNIAQFFANYSLWVCATP